MTTADRAKELEEKLSNFEKENPALAETVKLLGFTIEEYNKVLLDISAKETATSNSTEG